MLDKVKGSKTYVVAGITLAYAVVVLGLSQGDWHSAVPLISLSLTAFGIRAGLADAVKKLLENK